MKKAFLSIILSLTTTVLFAGTQVKDTEDKPTRIFLVGATMGTGDNEHSVDNESTYPAFDLFYTADTKIMSGKGVDWINGLGGTGSGSVLVKSIIQYIPSGDINYENTSKEIAIDLDWSGFGTESQTTHQWGSDWGNSYDYTSPQPLNSGVRISDYVVNEHCDVADSAHPAYWTYLEYTSNIGLVWREVTTTETYQRTAQAIWHVQTGGKAIAGRQNLWRFSGSAQEILNKRETPTSIVFVGDLPYPGLSYYQEIANLTQIKIGSLGNLKADGNLWITLPDGEENDITPVVAGKDFYTFGVGGQKYTLNISANGNNLSVTNPEFCVGQQVNFVPTWDVTPPVVSIDNIYWHLPDKFVNHSWQNLQYQSEYDPGTPYGSVNYDIDDNLLTSNKTSCWYVDGKGGTCSMREGLYFANGQFISIAAKGDLTIVKPAIVNISKSITAVNIFTNSDGSIDEIALRDNAGFGVQITVSMKAPDHFSGFASYTQLIKRYGHFDVIGGLGSTIPWWDTTSGDFWLDTSDPYKAATALPQGNSLNPIRPIYFPDSPGEGGKIYSFVECQDDFITYLQFKPNNGIPITIYAFHWGWHGKATKNSGVWSLDTATKYGPDSDPSDNSFPKWEKTYIGTPGN